MADFDNDFLGGDSNGQAQETQEYQSFDQQEDMFGGNDVQQEQQEEQEEEQQQEEQQEEPQSFDQQHEEALYDQQVQQYQSNPNMDTYVESNNSASSFNFIREFEKKRDEAVNQKKDKSAQAHQKIKEEAKKYREDFLNERKRRLDINHNKNKEQEEIVVSGLTESTGGDWANVFKYVDLSTTSHRSKKQTAKQALTEDEEAQLAAVVQNATGSRLATPVQPKKDEVKEEKKEEEVEIKDTTRLRKILLTLKNTQ